MPLSDLPFVLSLDENPYYDHNIFPNRMYRRLHARHHDSLDMGTLGLIASLGPRAHHLAVQRKSDGLSPTSWNMGKDKFEVHLDVGLFQPEDLSVKVVDDSIVVEGKHDEREDEHGHITRHFVRRYPLPKGYNPDSIVSTLSSDGALTVSAPKLPLKEEEKKVRIVQIQQTGPSELFLKGSRSTEEDTTNK